MGWTWRPLIASRNVGTVHTYQSSGLRANATLLRGTYVVIDCKCGVHGLFDSLGDFFRARHGTANEDYKGVFWGLILAGIRSGGS